MIISFGWTTPALLARAKTVTRRDWADRHAQQWRERFRDAAARGSDTILADAWNTSPRNTKADPPPGKIATIRLIKPPYQQVGYQTPAEDWLGEGFGYLSEHGYTLKGLTPRQLWCSWLESRTTRLWVVRFEVVRLTDYGVELRDLYAARNAT